MIMAEIKYEIKKEIGVVSESSKGWSVFCKHFLDKVAKYFWTLLQVQIGQSCKGMAAQYWAGQI
jgi:hypothetical protein